MTTDERQIEEELRQNSGKAHLGKSSFLGKSSKERAPCLPRGLSTLEESMSFFNLISHFALS